jgi:hypothetical protein
MFIPYKYTLNREQKNTHTLTIACRNAELIRKVFTIEVQPLSYLEVSKSIGEVDDIIKLLKSILNTDQIIYDENLRRYIVKGMIGVDDNIKYLFKSVISTPLKSSFMLQTLQRKYFDALNDNGQWTGIKSLSSNHITIFWSITTYDSSQISENGGYESNNYDNNEIITITFKKMSDKEEVQVWSTIPSMNSTKYFNNEDDMIRAFYKILTECDINITYGGKCFEWHYLLSKLSSVKSETFYKYDSILGNISYKYLNEPTIDHIDLSEIASLMYPHLVDYKFETIVKNLLEESCFEMEDMKFNIKADKEGTSTIFQKEKLKSYTANLIKNMVNLESIYIQFLPIITSLVYFSGCNWGEISDPDIFRSILGYINPLIANNTLINRLPEEYITRGIYDMPFIVPIGNLLNRSLVTSTDKKTVALGDKLIPLASLTWIMKNIYNLEGISPAKLPEDPTNIFGFRDNCFFTKSKLTDTLAIENMSKIIVISSDSWIGVTCDKNGKILFTYKGLAEACQHPFLAVKLCVELYLLTLTKGSKLDKKVAVQATNFLKETTVINKKVTKSNLSEYHYLLNDLQIESIKNKKIDFINLKVYYAKDNKYTTDYNHIDVNRYTDHLEKIMKTIPES